MNSLIKLTNNNRVFILNSKKFIKCQYTTNNSNNSNNNNNNNNNSNNNNNNNSPFSKNKKEMSKENQMLLEEIEAEAEEYDFAPYVNPKTGEIGGPKGPEPTRYNDWERAGRVSDF